MAGFFSSPFWVFSSAVLLRVVLFFYGLWQDANSPVKYTDIDYYVFTDAARFTAHNQSPYERETYRYTPLLAWLLLPTAWGSTWFSYGKILFAVGDIFAGWLAVLVLRHEKKMNIERALKFASIWLLNPMVATISTRGSSEGLLGVMVVAMLWAVTKKRVGLAGVLLGLAVHFKIYPFIYGPSIIWWMDEEHVTMSSKSKQKKTRDFSSQIIEFCNWSRILLVMTSLATFMALNVLMYSMYVASSFSHFQTSRKQLMTTNRYGYPFLQHTYLHHVTRIDHRHNFSPYNTLLYLSSARLNASPIHLESLAFFPQLFLSAFALPLLLAKKDLPSTMLAQTFAFVSFNKVCTSQVEPLFKLYHIVRPGSNAKVVFPLVSNICALLSTYLVITRETRSRSYCCGTLDRRPSTVAAAGLPA